MDVNIGSVKIEKPLVLAPMEDVSETPFRLICKRLGADMLVTEFASSEALIRDVRKTLHKIVILDEERPIGIQIFGAVPASMENAARIVEAANPEFIDINAGCWIRSFTSRGEGAALLKDLPKMETIIKAIVKAVKIPVTVKTRLGWDEKNIVILDVAKMVEQAGAKALTVHCRTRTQGYSGKADWTWLEKIKKSINIPLIGNGDIYAPEDAQRMFETGCDAVMIGRGAIINPFIFLQTKHFLKTGQYLPQPTIQEKFDKCIEHLHLSVKYKGPRDGVVGFRKHYAGYLHNLSHIGKLRHELMQMTNAGEIEQRLRDFLSECASMYAAQ